MIPRVGTTITLGSTPGGRDGYGHDLPLERELESPIVVDATSLRACHPSSLYGCVSSWIGTWPSAMRCG